MPNQKPVKVVFGAGFIGDALVGDDVKTVVDLFRKHGHVEIDTAAGYPINDAGGSEKALGQQDLDWARVSTKLSAMKERANSLENLREGLKDSLERLNRKDVDIYYFHLPEAATPMEEQAAAMDEAYRAGKFKRFGISNFTPQDVEELMEVVERKGYVRPSVLQGQYNLFARKSEEELLPVLRKHGIAYYAYSPAAAGLLTGKVSRENTNTSGSRWSSEHVAGQMYSASYLQDPIIEASQKIQEVAKKHGLTGHAASLRWCLHHSALSNEHGDAIIIGASKVDQLRENLEILDAGPLPDELVETIDGTWSSVKDIAPWAYFAVTAPMPKSMYGVDVKDMGIKT